MSRSIPETTKFISPNQSNIVLLLYENLVERRISIKKTTLLYLLSAFLLKNSLDLSSYYVLAGRYAPFTIRLDFSFFKLVESYALLMVIVLTMPKKQLYISTLIIWIFIILTYIPMLTVYGLSNESRIWMYATSGFWLFLFGLIQIYNKTIHLTKYVIKESYKLRLVLFFTLAIYTVAVIYSNPKFTLTIDLVKIYDVRANFYPTLPLANYVISWTALVINPIVIVFSLLRKKYILLVFVCLFQFFLFAALGQKLFLLSIPLIFGIFGLLAIRQLNFFSLSLSILFLIIIGYISFTLWEDVWLAGIFTNRLLVLPAVISFDYYDFFSRNPPTSLGHSIFRYFIQYPYDTKPWFVIGKYYFFNPDNSANTGMIADAYMNFRFWGLFLLAPIFAITLRLIDGFARAHDYRLVLAAVIMPILWSLNGSFLTSILSGGLGLAFLLLYMLPAMPVPTKRQS